MIRRLLPAAIGLAAVLALAGCGQATEVAGDPATSSGSSASATSTEPAPQAVAPTWPETCASHSMLSIDYIREPQGYATPQEAALDWAETEVDGVVPVVVPAKDHAPAGVALVDPATNEIQAQVTVIKGSMGWWVDGVESCS